MTHRIPLGTLVIDTKPLVLPFKKTKIKVPDHIEHCRKKIMRAMKAGGTLVVDLYGQCPDFENKVAIKKYKGAFPIELFNPATQESCGKGIFVRANGDGAPKVKSGFAVVVVADQSPEKYQKELKGLTDAINSHLSPIEIRE